MTNKTAKDIIIKLIDNHHINGEEAYILIEAIIDRSYGPGHRGSYTTPYTTCSDTGPKHIDNTTPGYNGHDYTVSNTSEVNQY